MQTVKIVRNFDETNVNWHPSQEYNEIFLRVQAAYFNHQLQARGHIFLNEVFDSLGFDRIYEGQTLGWAVGEDVPAFVSIVIQQTEYERCVLVFSCTDIIDKLPREKE